MFPCAVSTGIRYPYCHQGHSCSHESTTLPSVFWIHLVYLNSQIPPSQTLPIKLEDLDGTCIQDELHKVSCTLLSTCKFHTLTYSSVCILSKCVLCSAYFTGIDFPLLQTEICCQKANYSSKVIMHGVKFFFHVSIKEAGQSLGF